MSMLDALRTSSKQRLEMPHPGNPAAEEFHTVVDDIRIYHTVPYTLTPLGRRKVLPGTLALLGVWAIGVFWQRPMHAHVTALTN